MGNKVKDISIKNHTYYFFDDIINIKNFNPNNIEIDEKSYLCMTYLLYILIHYLYSYLLHWICDDQRFEIRRN